MRPLLVGLILVAACQAQKQGRVFLISLDGLGYQAFSEDPAAEELQAMRRLAEQGIYAPMQAAFPSLTAPGHASIFTGVYGNKNGVTSNNVPVSFGQRVNGFRGESLKAETFWVKAARSGVKSVAHNPTQGFPCNQFNSAPGVTLFNGYQTATVAPSRLLTAKDVKWLEAPPPGFVSPLKSRQPIRYFRYDAGRIQFVGAIFAKGLRYDTVRMTAFSGKRYVDAAWKDAESDSPRFGKQIRPLARFFSEALPVANLAAVHFRLFHLTSDAKDFLLYQSEGKELSVCADGDSQAVAFKQRLLNTAGGFVGNGAGGHFEAGRLGPRGTDGLAERRWLETLELHARQTMRHTRALMDEYLPRLLVDYISTPDDMLHVWWGLKQDGDAFQEPYRRWGYQIIDWRIDQLNQLLKPEDHFLIVSDHGMTVARHEIRLNTILDSMGVGDRVVAQDQFLQLKDRSDKALLKDVQAKLSTLKDGDTQLFTAWYWPEDAASKFGIGGDLGGDLYFDLAPGYTTNWTRAQPAIIHYEKPKGVHGPNPTRPDLFALFIASGPDLQSRPVSMRSIDVAPIVLRLLGL